MSKYSTWRDQALDELARQGWANESNGRNEAPTGWFARIVVEERELEELLTLLDGNGDPKELVGNWLLVEDEQGFVKVTGYDTADALAHAFSERVAQFLAWYDGEAE